MTAGELAAFMSALPPDTAVLIQFHHIERIRRERAGSEPRRSKSRTCDMGRCREWEYEWVKHPSFVNLLSGPLSGEHRITDDPPTVRLEGNWSRRARAAIGAES